MEILKNNLVVKRSLEYEIFFCIKENKLCQHQFLRKLFIVSSITGNGRFRYFFIFMISIIFGSQNIVISLRMTTAGLVGLLIYKAIKHYTLRPRPYTRSSLIKVGTPPLDEYSFPSGHTLHAVSFTIIERCFRGTYYWYLCRDSLYKCIEA